MRDEFISGIHNYCDRWCERCEFTARCRVAAMENELPDDKRDLNSEEFWRNLSNTFAEAERELREKSAELGIDFEDGPAEDDFIKLRDRQRELIESDELSALSDQYWKAAKKSLDAPDDWVVFSNADEQTRREMLEILGWYLFFVSAKVRRGLHGLFDYDGTYLDEELTDPQSDANGSIKVALIAVERSITAWTSLMTPENASVIGPHIAILKLIKQKANEKFPQAREFVRPGFDELELIM